MHENWVLGVVPALLLLPHSEVGLSLGWPHYLEGQAWRMVQPEEDGVQGGKSGRDVGGDWRRMAVELAAQVCDSHLGICVVTDSVQVS